MKRNIIYTAACLVAFASCQKQEVAESPSQVEVAVELTASAAADATKTVMTEYNAHWWSVSDKISLFYTVEGKTGHSVFTSKNYIPAASAKFAGSLSLPAEDTDLTTVSALAVYPATTADASDGTSVNVTVPSVQTAVEGSFMEGAYPVVAKTSDLTAALSFKAVCGGVKVSFQTPGITSFTFDAKEAKIAGKASVTFDTAGNPVAKPDESAVSVITVNAPAGGFEVGKWYYMTALPATISGGYKITLHGGEADGTELAGSSDITIKRSVFGVLDSKDAPDKYADLKANLKPISWWDENKNDMSEPVHAGVNGDQYQWKYNLNCIRFESDANYLYGYVEYTGTTDLSKFKNLGIWLDVDGADKGTGSWLFNSYPHFDLLSYGTVGVDGEKLPWTAKLYVPEEINGNPNIGKEKTAPSLSGYGEGSFVNKVFKYSFIIDRRVVGLRNMQSAVVGICFDNGRGFNSGNYVTVPDRAGYIVPLKNSTEVPGLKSLIKSFDYWTNVSEPKYTKDDFDKGKSVVKFDSDASYVYGYFEVNTDKLIYPENGFIRLHPGILANLAIGIDTDGIKEGQGPGWMFSNKGYDVVLNGKASSYTFTDKKGWDYFEWGGCASTITVDGVATKYKDFGDKFPDYAITPSVWTPKVYDMTTKADNWGTTVLAGTEGVDDIATGKGEWNSETKTFRYSFVLNREKLGIYGKDELEIGVSSYFNYTRFVCNPSRAGFTLKLNN